MKTCTFRPPPFHDDRETIFCSQPPSARYGMIPCRDRDCQYCYEPLDLKHRFETAVRFTSRQIHRFVSGYCIYLNGDTVCDQSSNNAFCFWYSESFVLELYDVECTLCLNLSLLSV